MHMYSNMLVVCMCYSMHVETRKQLVELSSVLSPLDGSQKPKTDCRL